MRGTLNSGSPYPTEFPIVASRGKTYYVDTNANGLSNNGQPLGTSWGSAFETMDEAFDVIASGDTIEFVGNVNEKLITPTGVADVTIRGVGNTPRHADTHPLNGELAASTWKIGSLSSGALLTVRCPGWKFENFLVAAHASNYAFILERNAIEDDTEIDASHATFERIRFASGAGGISDTGGCFNVTVKDCWFQALTTACILGVGNIGVGQLMWHIKDNHFNNFTNGVKIAAHECVITRNYFTDGGTPNTTFVLNTSNGAGRDNFVVDNWFQGTTANFNTPDIVGNATDVWYNHALDTAAAGTSGVFEVGQPA